MKDLSMIFFRYMFNIIIIDFLIHFNRTMWVSPKKYKSMNRFKIEIIPIIFTYQKGCKYCIKFFFRKTKFYQQIIIFIFQN